MGRQTQPLPARLAVALVVIGVVVTAGKETRHVRTAQPRGVVDRPRRRPPGAGAFASAQAPPGVSAGGERVIAFYVDHRTGQLISDTLWALAFACFVFFAGALRSYLRQPPESGALGALILAGAAVTCAGATTFFGFDYALASVPASLTPATAQALNVLALKLFLPLAAGGLIFGIAAGLAIIRSRALPAWLGALAILIGIACATPAGIAAIVALLLWTALVSILIFRSEASSRVVAGAGAIGD